MNKSTLNNIKKGAQGVTWQPCAMMGDLDEEYTATILVVKSDDTKRLIKALEDIGLNISSVPPTVTSESANTIKLSACITTPTVKKVTKHIVRIPVAQLAKPTITAPKQVASPELENYVHSLGLILSNKAFVEDSRKILSHYFAEPGGTCKITTRLTKVYLTITHCFGYQTFTTEDLYHTYPDERQEAITYFCRELNRLGLIFLVEPTKPSKYRAYNIKNIKVIIDHIRNLTQQPKYATLLTAVQNLID